MVAPHIEAPDCVAHVSKAVKTFKSRLTRPSQLQRKVQREVDILTSLGSHPNIVGFVDFVQEKHTFHLVMEHLGGGESMSGQAQQEALKYEVAMRYFGDAVAATVHLDTLNVLHRDLKPQNMILDTHGTLKLVDFGTATKLEHPHELVTGVVGTYMFCAPECHCGNVPYRGQGADIWALGVTLHQFLTGQVLFVAKTVDELKMKVLHSEVELPVWLPQDLQHLMNGMLCRNPKQRFTIHQIRTHSALNPQQGKGSVAAMALKKNNEYCVAVTEVSNKSVQRLNAERLVIDASTLVSSKLTPAPPSWAKNKRRQRSARYQEVKPSCSEMACGGVHNVGTLIGAPDSHSLPYTQSSAPPPEGAPLSWMAGLPFYEYASWFEQL